MDLCAVTPREIVAEATQRLAGAIVPEPRASAEILLSELLDIRRGEVAFSSKPLTRGQCDAFEAMISRRLKREPVQRILGYAYFRNLKLELSPATLIPRPDTESVVDVVLEVVDTRPGPCRVLDIGTGTGAIAISVAQERPACNVHASDVSREALQVAGLNAGSNGADVTLHESDLADGLTELAGTVDVLVSNPPYIEHDVLSGLEPEVRDHDPRLALDGGDEGLDFYRRILAETKSLLKPGADIVLEVGDGQADEVMCIGEREGFDGVGTHTDLAGSVRAVHLRWTGS